MTDHSSGADAPTMEELRLASDNFLTRVERLHALEEQKRERSSTDLAEIAMEVQALTEEILEWAERQTKLAAAAAADGHAPPIATVPPRAISLVLADWRDAERTLAAHHPGTAAYESALADVERLREEYARAYATRSAAPPADPNAARR